MAPALPCLCHLQAYRLLFCHLLVFWEASEVHLAPYVEAGGTVHPPCTFSSSTLAFGRGTHTRVFPPFAESGM